MFVISRADFFAAQLVSNELVRGTPNRRKTHPSALKFQYSRSYSMKTIFSIRAIAAAAAIAALSFVSSHANAQDKKDVSKARPVARAIASSPKVRPLSVNIDLISTTKLTGTLTDTTTLEMRTSFGTANIPLSEVAGIKFASADDASTTVVMLNGDSITGATDVKLVTVETEWGMATINGPNIASIMFVPGLTWSPTAGLNGKRWNLANSKSTKSTSSAAAPAAKTAPTPTAHRAPAATTRTTRNGYPVSQPTTTYRGR